jgi:hypothetical protein
MYHRTSDAAPLDWAWVDGQLTAAGCFWVVASTLAHPHPRPVWGVWDDEVLALSLGSPRLRADLDERPEVTVHLPSDTDVVVIEGMVSGHSADRSWIERYASKYDWHYDAQRYGPLTLVSPRTVIAWRSEGWAGRDGFRQSGRWRFDT